MFYAKYSIFPIDPVFPEDFGGIFTQAAAPFSTFPPDTLPSFRLRILQPSVLSVMQKNGHPPGIPGRCPLTVYINRIVSYYI